MVDWADANPRRITERFSRKIEPNAAVYLQRIKKNNFDISDLIVIWHELGASEEDILRFMKM